MTSCATSAAKASTASTLSCKAIVILLIDFESVPISSLLSSIIGVSPIPASVTRSAAVDNLVNGLAIVADRAIDKNNVTNIVIINTLTKPCLPS